MYSPEENIKIAKAILGNLALPIDESRLLKYAKYDHLEQVKLLLQKSLENRVDDVTRKIISDEFIENYSNIYMKGIK